MTGIELEARTAVEAPAGNASGLGGHPLHAPPLWRRLYPKSEVVDLVLRRGGETAALALGVGSSTRFSFRNRSRRELVIPYAPEVQANDPALASALLERIVEYGRTHGYDVVDLQWRYGYGLCPAPEAFEALGGDVHQETEFLIDLEGDEEGLLGTYAPGKRKHRKAGEAGLTVEHSGRLEDVAAIRSLQEASSARSRDKDNVYTLPGSSYYRRVAEACVETGLSRFIFARIGSERVSGLMYLVRNGRCVVQRGGTRSDGVECDAARFLHYELLRHLKQTGCRSVYFGSVPVEAAQPGHPEHGLYRFKSGFRAEQLAACRATIRVRDGR